MHYYYQIRYCLRIWIPNKIYSTLFTMHTTEHSAMFQNPFIHCAFGYCERWTNLLISYSIHAVVWMRNDKYPKCNRTFEKQAYGDLGMPMTNGLRKARDHICSDVTPVCVFFNTHKWSAIWCFILSMHIMFSQQCLMDVGRSFKMLWNSM